MLAHSLDSIRVFWYGWFIALPVCFWLALRWTGCKNTGFKAVASLTIYSVLAATVLWGLLMPVCTTLSTSDPVIVLSQTQVFQTMWVVCLILSSVLIALATWLCPGWRALVLGGIVAIWGVLWIAPTWVLLRMLGD